MRTPVDLDHLEKLHAEWHDDTGQRHLRDVANYHTEHCYGVALEFHNQSRWVVTRSAAYIAATHNALPALIAEVRALRDVAAAAEAYRACREGMRTNGGQDTIARRDTAARLAAALAKVPR